MTLMNSKAKTVSENLKMSGPILSRFDLVFILLVSLFEFKLRTNQIQTAIGSYPNILCRYDMYTDYAIDASLRQIYCGSELSK